MTYVHGYTDRESQRLREQSLILEELLHSGTFYAPGSRVLEVGCGVGAQTSILARKNPGIQLTSIDISRESVKDAGMAMAEMGFDNVSVQQADIFNHHFKPESFDHVFVCFVLEHLNDPVRALVIMKDLLRVAGTLTVIEGDHGSGFWTPETEASRNAWNGLITSQQRLGHDPNIGRRLYPLMKESGFDIKDVSPRPVYADQSHPVLLDGVVNQIIAPMVFSAEQQVLEERLVDPNEWKEGLKDISRVASMEDGSFFYTWFKGVGYKR